MRNKFSALIMSIVMVTVIFANTSLVLAGTPAPPSDVPDGIQYIDGDWVVAGSETYTDEIIVLTGNLSVPVGASLTIVNTTIQMNCTMIGEYMIYVGGNMYLQDGGDGLTPLEVGDADASVITSSNPAFETYMYVDDGAVLDVQNSEIRNVGRTDINGYLVGGPNVENVVANWAPITDGELSVTIDGVTADIWGLSFTGVTVISDVTTVIQDGIQAIGTGGFIGATVIWNTNHFEVVSGTTIDLDTQVGADSTVDIGMNSTASGTDISGAGWLDWTANARSYGADKGMIGTYIESSSVSITDSVIGDGGHGLIFDSCYPAAFTGNLIDNNDGIGLGITNWSNAGFNINYIVSNYEIINNGQHAIYLMADIINVEVFNMNISANGWGVNTYGGSSVTMNVHDCDFWRQDGTSEMDASVVFAMADEEGTIDMTVERNLLYHNEGGMIWGGIGWLDDFRAANHTTVLIANNTMIANDGHNNFNAKNDVNAKIVDNYITGLDGDTNFDGFRIGFATSSTGSDKDEFPEYTTVEFSRNIADMGVFGDGWNVGGWLRTAAKKVTNAVVIDNDVVGGYFIGGVFKIGHPSYSNMDPLDARFPNCEEVNAYFEGNSIKMYWDFQVNNGPDIGGFYQTMALFDLNMTMINNYAYLECGNSGSIVEAGWDGDNDYYTLNTTVWMIGNTIEVDMKSTSESIGGVIQILAEPDIGEVKAYLYDNDINIMSNDNDGGVIKIGGYVSDTPAGNVTARLVGNSLTGYYTDGSAVYLHIMGVENTRIDMIDNIFYLENVAAIDLDIQFFRMGGHSSWSDTADYLFANITDNVIIVNTPGACNYGGGLWWIVADEYQNVNIERNFIELINEYTDDCPSFGVVFCFGYEISDDYYVKDMDFRMIDNEFRIISAGEADYGNIFIIFADEELNVNISGNTFEFETAYYSSQAYVGGFMWIGYEKNSDEIATNTTLNMYDNVFDLDLGHETDVNGFIMVECDDQLVVNICGNEINSIYHKSVSGGGFFEIGYYYRNAQSINTTAKIMNNNIHAQFHDGSSVGTLFKILAIENVFIDMIGNDITVDLIGGYVSGIDLGGVIRIGRTGSSDDETAEVVKGSFSGNNIVVNTNENNNGGQILRLSATDLVDLVMNDNVIQAFIMTEDEDDIEDLGVRIGYECESNGIITDDVILHMSNNIIGPGAVGSALAVGANNNLTFDFIGGTLQGAFYCDSYNTEPAYGNGVSLQAGNTLNALIQDATIIDNRGAGIYASGYNDSYVDIINCDIIGNYYNGIYLNSDVGIMTSNIMECNIIDNANDYNGDVGSSNGIEAFDSIIYMENCTFDNPDADYELDLDGDTDVTALNTYFDKSSVYLNDMSAFLTGGTDIEVDVADWASISDGTFNITIDGVSADIGPINFGGDTTMGMVRDDIQIAITGAFPGTSVVWTGSEFMIYTSSNGLESSISVLSAHSGGLGTDISGLSASSFDATLTGGMGAISNILAWNMTTNGSFTITIDGNTANVGPINFTTATNMTGVANLIETAMQVPAGFAGSTCTWNGTSFIFTSGTQTPTTNISNVSAGTTGVDISGLMDSGDNGVVTLSPVGWWMDSAGNGITTAGTSSTLLLQWYMNVKAEHLSSGLGIPGATVDVWDVFGTPITSGTTAMDGYLRWIVVNEYYQTSTTQTNYTAHDVTVTLAPETGNANPIMDTTQDVIIILDYVSDPPIAAAGSDQTVDDGATVTLDGSGSTDDFYITAWDWSNATMALALSGETVDHVFAAPGVYEITLTTTDAEGYTDTDTVVITVLDITPPTANAGPDQIVDEDTVVIFNETGSDNVGVVNYTWTFNDGTNQTLYGESANYTFAEPGTYNVTLTVADEAGLTDTDVFVVTVLDITPPEAIDGDGQTVADGTTVVLDGSASTDNVGVVAYEWTFNDGANDVVQTGAIMNHTFMTLGNYTVILQVWDAAGLNDTLVTWVNVVDMTAPDVLVIAPGNGLEDVPVEWDLIIVFTETMDTASVEAAFSVVGTNVTGFAWDISNSYVTITFDELDYDTIYEFTVGADAEDIAGNTMGTAHTDSFLTALSTTPVPVPTEDDTDGDGVDDVDDAFPDDPAASVDTDGDGEPDSWNPGYTAADSTTNLTEDMDDDNDGILDVDDDPIVDDDTADDDTADDDTGGNDFMWIIIIIILVVIIVLQAVMKGKKPEDDVPEPTENIAEPETPVEEPTVEEAPEESGDVSSDDLMSE